MSARSNSNNNLFSPSLLDVGTTVKDVSVIVSRVVFEKNGFVIFYCDSGISVKGNYQGTILPGLTYLISGEVGLYGKVIQISTTSIIPEDENKSKNASIASFLSSSFSGLGERISHALANEYGGDVLEELKERPSGVAKRISGLSEKRARQISDEITEKGEVLLELLRLRIIGLSDEQAKRTYDLFGMGCSDDIEKNPYLLLKVNGIGFETCEFLAKNSSFNPLDSMRILGAIISVLNEYHYSSGNTYIATDELQNKVSKLVLSDLANSCDNCNFSKVDKGCDKLIKSCPHYEEAFLDALNLGVSTNEIVIYRFNNNKCEACDFQDDGARVAKKKVFGVEAGIKKEIESFVKAIGVFFNEEQADRVIDRLSEQHNIVLDEYQHAAIKMAMREPFSIITGGSGTGKTTITGVLASHFREKRITAVFCAPTGRAAKRLSQAIGEDALTIHRLLEVRPSDDEEGFVFGRNESNPLETRVVVVDEASMVDNSLFLSLLKAIRKDCSVILIGDPNQLPSVSAGNLLSDLLSCISVPRTELKYVFRQDDDSSIAANAYRILDGKELIANDKDFVIIDVKDEDEGFERLAQIYSENRHSDIAILSPTKQNSMGTNFLNRELQTLIVNPEEPSLAIGTNALYRETDRVMQVKNDYKIEYIDSVNRETGTGIYNGELGRIIEINEMQRSMIVRFDDNKEVLYENKTLEDIDLAYVLTVHKSQGCEFDTVVICLGKMSPMLRNRKLLYTAVTRGKRKVIIINCFDSLDKMIKSKDSYKRMTSLSEFLRIIDVKYGKNKCS